MCFFHLHENLFQVDFISLGRQQFNQISHDFSEYKWALSATAVLSEVLGGETCTKCERLQPVGISGSKFQSKFLTDKHTALKWK